MDETRKHFKDGDPCPYCGTRLVDLGMFSFDCPVCWQCEISFPNEEQMPEPVPIRVGKEYIPRRRP